MKNTARLTTIAAFVALLVACASVDSRISKQQTLFDSWPVETQNAVRAGEIKAGMTADMVRVALGEPDAIFERQTAEGKSEVWAYADSKPSFSIGLGVGGGGGSTSVGTGVTIDGGGNQSWKIKVVLTGGLVTAVEKTKR